MRHLTTEENFFVAYGYIYIYIHSRWEYINLSKFSIIPAYGEPSKFPSPNTHLDIHAYVYDTWQSVLQDASCMFNHLVVPRTHRLPYDWTNLSFWRTLRLTVSHSRANLGIKYPSSFAITVYRWCVYVRRISMKCYVYIKNKLETSDSFVSISELRLNIFKN